MYGAVSRLAEIFKVKRAQKCVMNGGKIPTYLSSLQSFGRRTTFLASFLFVTFNAVVLLWSDEWSDECISSRVGTNLLKISLALTWLAFCFSNKMRLSFWADWTRFKLTTSWWIASTVDGLFCTWNKKNVNETRHEGQQNNCRSDINYFLHSLQILRSHKDLSVLCCLKSSVPINNFSNQLNWYVVLLGLPLKYRTIWIHKTMDCSNKDRSRSLGLVFIKIDLICR